MPVPLPSSATLNISSASVKSISSSAVAEDVNLPVFLSFLYSEDILFLSSSENDSGLLVMASSITPMNFCFDGSPRIVKPFLAQCVAPSWSTLDEDMP